MAFVHGHPRDLTWVKGHYRAPNSAEEGQLGLEFAAPDPDLDDPDPDELVPQPRPEVPPRQAS
ncbi:MAG: hypothetical protein OJJ54_08140 [Pseudonocardia sp.]|nr:hypothetical protein [Pseudonocardia sp.]